MAGIFPPLDITNTANVDPRGLGISAWFSAVPRTPKGSSRNMVGFTLGLQQDQVRPGTISSTENVLCQLSEARLQSRLWVLDNRGRVKFGSSQSHQARGALSLVRWLRCSALIGGHLTMS